MIMKLYLFIVSILICGLATAQDTSNNKFGKGITIQAKDQSFKMKFSTRFQTLYEGKLNLDSDDWSDKLLIRRARLKFEGFVYDPKFEYKIELGLSNRDIGGTGPDFNNGSNIILDAVAKWKFHKNWALWFGQTKLPGNRERVISSQKLQFVDRSLVNSRFNIDRDLGVQLHHKGKIGDGILKQAIAISMGEGRNITSSNPVGYDYTGRLEYLPFGDFTNKGDYFGSDLEREEKPKLSVGITYSFNDNAVRQRGQLGSFVTDSLGNKVTSDLKTFFVDAVLKYRGWSLTSEYGMKTGDDIAEESKFALGKGLVVQTGYLFDNDLEVAFRFTSIEPDNTDFSSLKEETEYTLGFSKYIVGHSLKVQSDFSYTEIPAGSDEFRYRFQVEVSF